MKGLIEIFEGIFKTLLGAEPVKLNLIYPKLSRPEVHKLDSIKPNRT
ncbi:MAG: hypothetical protein ACYDEQ_03120 [Desulfocucumaceae bacterium]